MRFLISIYARLRESCMKTCLQNDLHGVHSTYIFRTFFLKRGGTLEQGAVTYSAQQIFSWGHVETCSGDPKVHQSTHEAESWGGCRGTPLCSPTNSIFINTTTLAGVLINTEYFFEKAQKTHISFDQY